ncbi:MAG TPA: hypothetical protein VIS48_06960 [Candidatus Kryptonia bacterium]
MKRSILILATCLALGAAGVAKAQDQPGQQPAKKPGEVTKRQINQQRRIKQGVKSGQLTPRETRNLERQRGRIQRRKMVDKAKNGGTLTKKDKAQLNRMENRSSRNIYRKKHNARIQH